MKKGLPSALFKVITNKDDLEYVYKNRRFFMIMYVCCFMKRQIIPLELLIAAFQKNELCINEICK